MNNNHKPKIVYDVSKLKILKTVLLSIYHTNLQVI